MMSPSLSPISSANDPASTLVMRIQAFPEKLSYLFSAAVNSCTLQQFRRGARVKGDADRAARDFSGANDIVVNFREHIDGDGEADAFEAAALRFDGAVDADHLAADIEQGTAAVALVDGRVGLQEA